MHFTFFFNPIFHADTQFEGSCLRMVDVTPMTSEETVLDVEKEPRASYSKDMRTL